MDMSTNMKWEERVEKYPDRWVALNNVVKGGLDIVSGDVVAVKTDDEICGYEDEHIGEGLIFRRTTEGYWDGIINSDFAITVY